MNAKRVQRIRRQEGFKVSKRQRKMRRVGQSTGLRQIRAVDVIAVVEAAIERYGVPEHIRSDNGPEFIAYAIQDWLKDKKIKSLYIKPGSPWKNGHIESFHDKFRDEFLNREIFGSILEAKVLAEQWRIEYNQQRPHSSLGYQTPDEFAASCQTTLRPALRLTASTQ